MKKISKLVLMLCLVFSGAFSYAHGIVKTGEKTGEDSTPILIIEKASYTSSEKGNSIVATIDAHYLIVVFTENLGQVAIEVATASGVSVQFTSTQTPNGVQCYIPNIGDYIVTFTLPNGDEYYGEFTVTD